jgi:hypothetical protein
MKVAKRFWNVDLFLPVNIAIQVALLSIASDPSFSNGELFIVYACSIAINYTWLKQKLCKLSKTGGLTALLILLSGSYTAKQDCSSPPVVGRKIRESIDPKSRHSFASHGLNLIVMGGGI